ncbi:MAG: threonine/homoserine/homoserine lactone efflux protein [Gammaproteobacteria bacterium]|jgi:threonine/homoserine/homoserine lactone efflux protein
MGITTALALFSTLLVLAAIPSLSVFAVSARAASSGFWHGVLVALGIVTADILLILIAIFGLSILYDLLGDVSSFVQYIGAAYLFFLGITLWLAKPVEQPGRNIEDASMLASFMAGFLLTLADQKAIFFYLGFLPAFINLGDISWVDTGIIMILATVSVGGVKVFYAWMADRASTFFTLSMRLWINRVAGTIMFGVGVALLLKS